MKTAILLPALLLVATALHASAQATADTYTPINDPNLSPNAQDQNGNQVTLWNCTFAGGGADSPYDDGSYFDSSTPAWGLWSNDLQAMAKTTFAGGALAVGQSVAFDFLNGYVNNQVGFDITNSSDQSVLSVWFPSGSSDYQYYDNAGVQSTGLGWENNTFIPFQFTLTGINSYSASFGGQSWSGALANGGGSVTGVDWYNNAQVSTSGENNVEVSSYSIAAAAVPEPGQVALMAVGGAVLIARFGRRRKMFMR